MLCWNVRTEPHALQNLPHGANSARLAAGRGFVVVGAYCPGGCVAASVIPGMGACLATPTAFQLNLSGFYSPPLGRRLAESRQLGVRC